MRLGCKRGGLELQKSSAQQAVCVRTCARAGCGCPHSSPAALPHRPLPPRCCLAGCCWGWPCRNPLPVLPAPPLHSFPQGGTSCRCAALPCAVAALYASPSRRHVSFHRPAAMPAPQPQPPAAAGVPIHFVSAADGAPAGACPPPSPVLAAGCDRAHWGTHTLLLGRLLAGPHLEVPVDATRAQLEALLNSVLRNEERLPYALRVDGRELLPDATLDALLGQASAWLN